MSNKNKSKLIKRLITGAMCLTLVFSINGFAAVVSDNDGSAFITKAEFDSLKNNFQSQIDQYNQSIDSKIDGAIASYLSGIQLTTKGHETSLFDGLGKTLKTWKGFAVVGRNNQRWFYEPWASGNPFGNFDLYPTVQYWVNLCQSYGSSSITLPGMKLGSINLTLHFCEKGSANQNMTGIAHGNAISGIHYGERCIMQTTNSSSYYWNANNWLGGYPVWFGTSNGVLNTPTITFANTKPSYQVWNGNVSSWIDWNWKASQIVWLRDGAASGDYTAYTPTRALTHTTGTRNTTNWSIGDIKTYTGVTSYWQSSNVQNAAYVMNSAPSSTFGDNMCYFWPGGGDKKLFLMDQDNVGINFVMNDVKKADDGTLYKWGQWDELNWQVDKAMWRANFDEDIEDVAKKRGYTVLPHTYLNGAPSGLNISFDGKLATYDKDNRRKELNTIYWNTPTSTLGTDVLLGETPILLHDVSANGKLTIDGPGLKLTYSNATYDYKDANKIFIAFTHTGASNEVNTGTAAAPNWTVNNTIPFQYKNASTAGAWVSATNNKFYQVPGAASEYTNFRFNVEKGDDVYMHVVCEDFRDDQNIIVAIDPTTVCSLEKTD